MTEADLPIVNLKFERRLFSELDEKIVQVYGATLIELIVDDTSTGAGLALDIAQQAGFETETFGSGCPYLLRASVFSRCTRANNLRYRKAEELFTVRLRTPEA